ncbi:ArnT family glycosyltransferase [Actinokineospora spheciospongiae]|uniref:ArnT family glycosyltransferase n=1 Tax=Actinokineospora spheciospongiae TaxID=909613 RepID=UPI000D716571|nr:glycosyltransferase family 39 protein [Actinokineospora spheciospongiae]PWW52715.1 dolichyl-phosphate-mannose-protein mannosyltransferase [Actinokineospora spheciospongiae]
MSATEERAQARPPAVPLEPAVPPVRWGPLLSLAAGVGVLLLLVSGRYGHDGDEMYFVIAGGHPSWGYVDQSALVPLLAKGIDLLFPGNLLALRTPSALVTAVGVVLAGLIARELGGRPRAQLLAAAAFGAAPFVLWTGHLLATTTFDTTLWAAITYLVTRWVRTRQDRLLLAAGLCTAVALQIKYLVPILWVAIGVAALCTGRGDLLRRPLLWVGAGVTVVTALPGLLWQNANGWPYVAMLDAVSAEQDSFQGGRVGFSAWLALYIGPLGLVLVVLGIRRLLRTPPYRFLGVALPVLFVLMLVFNGRPYYLVGLFPLGFAAGVVALQDRGPAWWRRPWAFGLTGVLGAIAVVCLLPVVPQGIVERHPALVPNPLLRGQVGWPAFTEDIGDIYRSLPPEQRAHTVVMADVYPHASALAYEGPAHGLPPVYSGHRGFWFFGAPPDDATTAIIVGGDPGFLRAHFRSVRAVGRADDHSSLENVVLRSPTVWLVSDPVRPWSKTWPEWLHMNIDDDQ